VGDRDHGREGSRPSSAILTVILPIAVLIVAIAVVSGRVFGGVLQGQEERVGPSSSSTTLRTILIEP
jgi:hypothetical protein